MNTLITIISIFAAITIYKNLGWFKYMWKEHLFGWFPEDSIRAPFCFDCNLSNEDCKVCAAIKEYHTDPDRAWELFDDMTKRRNMPFVG